MKRVSIPWGVVWAALLTVCMSAAALAAGRASVRGTVADPLGPDRAARILHEEHAAI